MEYSTDEIAKELEKSKRTIEGYKYSLLEKLPVKNTAGLVLYAIRNSKEFFITGYLKTSIYYKGFIIVEVVQKGYIYTREKIFIE